MVQLGVITTTTLPVATAFDGTQCCIVRRIMRTIKNENNIRFVIRTNRAKYESYDNEGVPSEKLVILEKMENDITQTFSLSLYDALVSVLGTLPEGFTRSEEDNWIEQNALLRITKNGIGNNDVPPYGTANTDWKKLNENDWDRPV